MSQLPILAKSKSIYICLWKYTGKVNNKYADIYIITCFLLAKWKSNDISIKNPMFYQLKNVPTNQLNLSVKNKIKKDRQRSTKIYTENNFEWFNMQYIF